MKMLVFNHRKWNYQDVGDNSQFWEEAEILRKYRSDRGPKDEILADVKFPNGNISTGHIVSMMKEIPSD